MPIPSQRTPDRFKRGAQAYRDGLVAAQVASATFDPSANTAQRPVGAYGLGVYIPVNATIVRSWYEVLTAFTSAGGNTGTVALSVEAANDIKTATAVSDATLGTTGIKAGVSDGTTANMKKTTAERQLTATVATQALTAGKLRVFVEYVVTGA